MRAVTSNVFGLFSIYDHASALPSEPTFWKAPPQNYPWLGDALLDVLIFGRLDADPALLAATEEAHRALRAIAGATKTEVSQRLWELCRQFDALTGITSDAEALRQLPEVPPWVRENIDLADRLGRIRSPEDIWDFVTPSQVLYGWIPHETVVAACVDLRTDWDTEHGVQVILRRGNEIHSVGVADGFLVR